MSSANSRIVSVGFNSENFPPDVEGPVMNITNELLRRSKDQSSILDIVRCDIEDAVPQALYKA